MLLKGCSGYTSINNMSAYLVIENPASEAKTKAFASFDELKTWVHTIDKPKTLSELYKNTMYD